MKVAENMFVSMDYTLTVEGEVVDKSEPGDPLGFVSGMGKIISGLDNAIQGKAVGDKVDVVVAPEDGYGEVEEALMQEIPKEHFPEGLALEPDMVFQAETPHGVTSFRIAEVADDHVVADLNHPLAGKTLSFSVTILEVREATPDELRTDDCGSHECTGCGCH